VNHTKDSALGSCSCEGARGITRVDNSDCAAAAKEKEFLTLRAQLALAGHELTRTRAEDGSVRFFVGRWGKARELADIDAVRAFAEQVGAAK
jgi:hypothetical protein